MKRYHQKTYRMDYFFFIGEDGEKVTRFIKKRFGIESASTFESNDGECIKVTSDEALVAIIIWTSMTKKQKNWTSTIAHECLHAANITLHSRGVTPTYENDEPQTYLMSELITAAEKAK